MRLSVRETVLLPLFGALMIVGDIGLEALPNVHLVGVLTVLCTVLFRAKALFSVYLYVLGIGLLQGFGLWWIPYLYVWTVLWGAVMLLPRHLPPRALPPLLALVAGLHGLAFGTLFAPVQALLFRFSFHQTLLWIAAGFGFDLVHAASNFILTLLVSFPLLSVSRRLKQP